MSINIVIDNYIRINPHDFPTEVINNIKNSLIVPNPAKNRAEREMLWGAKKLPDYIELWDEPSPRELVLPRAHWDIVSQFAYNYKLDLNWIHNTVCDARFFLDIYGKENLRDYQYKAVDSLLQHKEGIYSAPTGAGKTFVMLEVARSAHQKTIIICEKTDILFQWIKSANELGFRDRDIGIYGDGTWVDGPLVLALRQSLINKDLDQSWYKQFGTVIYDEIHHGSAPTAYALIQKFPALYRFGCSATPDSDPDLFPLIRAAIGPVVVESSPKEIGSHLITPSVRVVDTEFTFPYRPTLRLENGRVERNNYSDLLKALEQDDFRNGMIIDRAMDEALEGHHCLIISKRKNHLENIENKMYDISVLEPGKSFYVFILTGDNSKEYSEIKKEIESSDVGTITFSTLADEGTDIPIWDRLFLAYPGRKLRGYEQAIGRIMRPHPKKKDAIIYDFRDKNVSLLNSQYRFRAQGIYNKKEYKIEKFNG